jgi:tetrapyrrole methylase family protein/MazG family protein
MSQDLPLPGTPPDATQTRDTFQELCNVIARLRSPTGCPWDRVQTLATIKPFTLEETYELLEAIDSNDDAAICEELGDVLLQVVLDSQIAADEGRFTIIDVIAGLTKKMVERHPHVFGDAEAHTPEDVKRNWERIKSQEKEKRHRTSALDGIPIDLPALAKAARITKKAARVGYDFPHRNMLFDKLREEVRELTHELADGGELEVIPATVDLTPVPDEPVNDPERLKRIESELGDVLFVVANIARRWGVNPEEALRHSNAKFTRRFQAIEQSVRDAGKTIDQVTLLEMEEFYQQAKQRERDSANRP